MNRTILAALLCALLPVSLSAQGSSNNDSISGIAKGAVQALQALSSNPIVATNTPSAADQALQGLPVGSQTETNPSILATNTPSAADQSVTGASVLPQLSSNPPVPPPVLNAGTNSLTNLPQIAPPDLPSAPMITNPVTPGSLPAPLPTTATGPISMPTAGTNLFGLKNSVKDIPLTAEALAKAGNAVIPGVIAKNARKLTIDEAVQLALQKNPNVLTAINSIRQASGNFITVRAGLLPQFAIAAPNAYQWSCLLYTSPSPRD